MMTTSVFPDQPEFADAPVGGKASALGRLVAKGFPVPGFFVVLPSEDGVAARELDEALDRLTTGHAAEPRFAVRSSALDEDGAAHSFAGQLESYLEVPRGEVAGRIDDVRQSGRAERVEEYRRQHGLSLPPPIPAVIVQILLEADCAGVAFSANPTSGARAEGVISAVRGLGEALVSGQKTGEHWRVTHDGSIRAHSPPEESEGFEPILTETRARDVLRLALRCQEAFRCPQDIEWAFTGERLWLLQSRPVTTLGKLPDPEGELILWDNSNIAESYNGITTPLTFSFARRVYEEVYREFCRILRVPEARIADHAETFRCMLGLIRGRVYYNLLNWYRVLALLPGFDVNRRFMEEMMGVKDPLPEEIVRRVLGERRAVGGPASFLAVSRTLLALIWQAIRLEHTKRAFLKRLDEALATADSGLETLRIDALTRHYRHLERRLLTHWDAPLINDFLTMIVFGLFRNLCAKWLPPGSENVVNDLVMGEGDIISAEPARRIRAMAALIGDDPGLARQLAEIAPGQSAPDLSAHPQFAARFQEYLTKFGDRCLEELKLETVPHTEDPSVLLRTIGALALHGAPAATGNAEVRGASREAEERALREIGCNPLRRGFFRWLLGLTRARVRDRENLRFERTRVFGRVRRIFRETGKRLAGEGLLEAPRDIFYLTLEEILGVVEGATASGELAGVAELRRREFGEFHNQPAPAQRFTTRGAPLIGNAFDQVEAPTGSQETQAQPDAEPETSHGRLRGIGCCAGLIEGRARVIRDPAGATIEPGDLLIAERTDPGWIMLFASAGGVAVEHGSLLSHSAIVARELGIPAVVAVPGLMNALRDGERIRLNGSTGEIVRLEEAPNESPAEDAHGS